MNHPIIYVELKSGYSDHGPAWIGRADYSKSRKMLYFNGMALRQLSKRQNFATHVNPETRGEFWVSGVKKDQADRHWAGSGVILVDQAVLDEYLKFVGATSLNKTQYKVVPFKDNAAIRAKANEMENRKLS